MPKRSKPACKPKKKAHRVAKAIVKKKVAAKRRRSLKWGSIPVVKPKNKR